MIKQVTLKLFLTIIITSLTGCGSFLNIGSPEYSCSGMPEGAQCRSARDVYDDTNNGSVLLPMKGTSVVADSNVLNPESKKNDNYVAPHLTGQPIPIRTPAQVMRIWVSPWEDKSGDLVMPGYIYTEIEPRRWIIGDKETNDTKNFKLIK